MRAALVNAMAIRPIRAMIIHCTTEVFLDNLQVPIDALAGEESKGARDILDGMSAERVLTASGCVGGADGLVARAAQYGNERPVLDRSIGQSRAIQLPIAEAYAATRAAALMRDPDRALCDANARCGEQAKPAEYLRSEASWKAAGVCVQSRGGYAFAGQYVVERESRDARL